MNLKLYMLKKSISLLILAIISSLSASGQYTEVYKYTAFAKVYGYVRYFYPDKLLSNEDWDKFAYYSVSQLEEVEDVDDLNAKLIDLFNPIAPELEMTYEKSKVQKANTKRFKNDIVFHQYKGWSLHDWSIYRNEIIGNNTYTIKNNSIYREIGNIDTADKIRLSFYSKADLFESEYYGDAQITVYYNDYRINERQVSLIDKIKSKEWTEYQIEFEIDDEIDLIYVEFSLYGLGKMFVDSCHLEIYDSVWSEVDLKNIDFEELNTFNMPSHWNMSSDVCIYSLSDERISGDKSLLIETKKSLLPGGLFCIDSIESSISEKISNNLFCTLPLVFNIHEDRRPNNHLVGDLKSKLDIINIDSLLPNDKTLQISNAIILWNIIKYFNPLSEDIDNTMNDDYKILLNTIVRSENNWESYLKLLRLFIVNINDGHGVIYHDSIRSFKLLPIKVDKIEDRIIVIESNDTSICKIGDEILSVNGIPALEKLENDMSFITGNTEKKEKIALIWYFVGEADELLTIEIGQNGKTIEKEVVRDFIGRIKSSKSFEDIAEIKNDIYYINLNSGHATWRQIDSLVHIISKAKGVIFDLRDYPNYGNHKVISHLINESVKSDYVLIPKRVHPNYVSGYDSSETWIIEPSYPTIEGCVVFLSGKGVVSYTESILGIIDAYDLGIIIGSRTGGINGDINSYDLLGGYSYTWTGLRVEKHNGECITKGITPDIIVNKSITGVREGKDEVLDYAIQYIESHTE
jgi:C-terminal processing protease CtpA/Prc